MSVRNNYKHTITACYIAGVTQAIIVNFAPLLFLNFHNIYGISFGKIGLLVSINFMTQLLVDFLAIKLIDKIGYRAGIVSSHVFSAMGLIAMGILPDLLPSPYVGLCLSTILYAIGGGLTEVLSSPIVEACPTDKKSAAMSVLHSFYSWGSAFVILVSTLCLRVFGVDSWRYISFAWAVIPIFNIVYFCFVPINTWANEGEGMKLKELFGLKIFWLFILLMLCSGAAEQAMAQWASAFAESGLKVSKTVGDIAGPCLFAFCMGTGRVLQAKLGEKFKLDRYLFYCGIGCIVGYLISALSPIAVIGLLGCGVCGFSVAAMWPGTLSLAAAQYKKGGTALFAVLALAGDLGCSIGPALVGAVSSRFGDDLKIGLLVGTVFSVLLVGSFLIYGLVLKKAKKENIKSGA